MKKSPELHAKIIIDLLAQIGVAKAVVDFAGGGDQGDISGFLYYDRDDEPMTIPDEGDSPAALAVAEFLARAAILGVPIDGGWRGGLDGLLEGYFNAHLVRAIGGDWVNGDGGHGSVVFLVEERKIEWSASFNRVVDGDEVSGQISALSATAANVKNSELLVRLGLLFTALRKAKIKPNSYEISGSGGDDSSDGFVGYGSAALEHEALWSPVLPIYLKAIKKLKLEPLDPSSMVLEAEAIIRGLQEAGVLWSDDVFEEEGCSGDAVLAVNKRKLEWTLTLREMSSDDGSSGELDVEDAPAAQL